MVTLTEGTLEVNALSDVPQMFTSKVATLNCFDGEDAVLFKKGH